MERYSLYTLGSLSINASKHYDCIEAFKKQKKKTTQNLVKRTISLENSADSEQNTVNLTLDNTIFMNLLKNVWYLQKFKRKVLDLAFD